MEFYKINDVLFEDGVTIRIEKFTVIGETPCGNWVVSQYMPDWLSVDELKKRKYAKWVSKNSVKKLCYPDLEGAIHSFYKRKLRQVGRLKYQLEQAQVALDYCGQLKGKSADDFSGGVKAGPIPSQDELCWDY